MILKCNIVLPQLHKLHQMYQYSIKFEISIPNTVAIKIYFESKVSFFFLFVNINSLLVKGIDNIIKED